MRHIRISRPGWFVDAACRGNNDPAFFATKPAAVAAAIRQCADCAALDPCRSYAIDHVELLGVWGGTTEDDRHTLRRETA